MAYPQIFQVNFGDTEMPLLHKYIKDNVEHIKLQVKGLREDLLPKWVKIYRGTPAEEEATFPWPGAANLVIQVAGTHCDELLSRVMAIWANSPLWVAEIYGDYNKGEADDQREQLERFLEKQAFESSELDLYRVEETMFSSTIRYGTGIVKIPYEYLVEKAPVFIPGASVEGSETIAKYGSNFLTQADQTKFTDLVKRDGPHPEPVPLNLWGIDPRYPNLYNAPFVYHILKKTKTQLLEMKLHPEIYDPALIDDILTQGPTRYGPDDFTMELQSSKKAWWAEGDNDEAGEYDIYECWYRYRLGDVNYSLVSYYSEKLEKTIGTIFNMYPKNESPFVDSKLAYDDDMYYGYGFAEMLNAYQQDISKNHNWRRNNKDFATTGIGRVNKNSKLSSIVQLFPGLLIPSDEGEIEPLQFGAGALQYGVEDEQLTLALAKERSGVDPAIGGAGGGVVNAKRGIYSAQGTAAVMQQQNNRNNLRMSDMRSAHVRIGRKILNIYSHFGISTKLRMLGDNAEVLSSALKMYKDEKLGLGIKASTASVNRELEKQNDILLSATLERLYAGDAQIIQSLVTPGISKELGAYYLEVLAAKNSLMKHILRNFGRDDVDRLVPVPDFLKKAKGALSNGSGANGNTGAPGQNGQGQGQNQGAIPIGGGQTGGGVPTVATPEQSGPTGVQ